MGNLTIITGLLLVVVMLHETNGIWRRRRPGGCTAVNCSWGGWSEWGSCSAPCGNGGTSTRTRAISQQPSCGGRGCSGSSQATKSCNRFCLNGGKPNDKSCDCTGLEFYGTCCTSDCVRSSWGLWSVCSGTCGDPAGKQKRTRSIGSTTCSSSRLEERTCNRTCGEEECVKGSWGEWGYCFGSCDNENGVQIRTRSVDSASVCRPFSEEKRICEKICDEKECVTGEWLQWSDCSATCEKQDGVRFRSRTVDSTDVCCSFKTEQEDCLYQFGKKCGKYGEVDREGKCECYYTHYGDCCEKKED